MNFVYWHDADGYRGVNLDNMEGFYYNQESDVLHLMTIGGEKRNDFRTWEVYDPTDARRIFKIITGAS